MSTTFILNEEGDCLQVSPRWLQHLQVTHLAFHATASRRANNADLFSLHRERDCQQVKLQVAAAPPGDMALTQSSMLLSAERIFDGSAPVRGSRASLQH